MILIGSCQPLQLDFLFARSNIAAEHQVTANANDSD
jgi:hypothetical protein